MITEPEVATTVVVPEIAFQWGYHQISHNEMAADLKKRLDARPSCQFSEMKTGRIYLFMHGYDRGRQEVMMMIKMLPSGKQADVNIPDAARAWSGRRIFASRYYGKFIYLSAELESLLGVTHRAVIEEFIRTDGVDAIPPLVRRAYPELFIDIPDRFAVPNPAYISGFQKTKAERI